MADKGVIFSAAMVRALLDGRKTQTRRAIPEKAVDAYYEYDDWCSNVSAGVPTSRQWERDFFLERIRFRPGDRLYVREEWFTTPAYDDLAPSEMGGDEPLRYKADDATFNWTEADGSRVGRRRAGMHMPRWASRLTLTVTEVRVERLQDCSEADALAEGIGQFGRFFGLPDADWDEGELSAVAAYHRLWNSINGPGSWEANPWVVAVTFAVENRNIDA